MKAAGRDIKGYASRSETYPHAYNHPDERAGMPGLTCRYSLASGELSNPKGVTLGVCYFRQKGETARYTVGVGVILSVKE